MPLKLNTIVPGLVCALLLASASCGDEADIAPSNATVVRAPGDDIDFGDDTRVVVTSDGVYEVSGHGNCVEIEGVCFDIDEESGRYCDDPNAQADLVIIDGEIVEVICYPSPDDGTPVEELEVNESGDVELPQNMSGTVITFPEDTNGEPIEDNIDLEGERVTLFGNGIDETILAGNLTVASNNSRVRGLTVQGDVTYTSNSNGSALSFCKIHGNLTIDSNNVSVLNCVIFGNVTVNGNNLSIVNVDVAGEWQVGSADLCDNNHAFTDENEDFEFDKDVERGALLGCPEADPESEEPAV